MLIVSQQQDAKIVAPRLEDSIHLKKTKDKRIYPRECRQRHTTYSGKMYMTVEYAHDGKVMERHSRLVGQVPIMIKVRRFFLSLVFEILLYSLIKTTYK